MVCAPASSSNPSQASGGTTVEERDASGDLTGSTTTTSTSSCNGASCTTTTTATTRDASGTVTGSVVTTSNHPNARNEVQRFCDENPESPICKRSTWAGTCSAGFSCDGDAVQCAIAREQHRVQCEAEEAAAVTTGTTGQARDAIAGTPDPTGEAFRNPTATNLPSSFDTADALSGSSCPGPWPVSVLGTSISITVEPICDLAEYIRPLVIAFSLLLGVRIAFGGA
jgi:hypothetical protein